jgi:hypothetical protein
MRARPPLRPFLRAAAALAAEELFGRVYATQRDARIAADHLSLAEQDRWNQTVLPLHGIGEDCFYLNESFPRRKNILHFESLRDFDEFDYRFQEEARRKEDANYAAKPYRGSLYMNWARLYVKGRFAYATLSMAAGYIYAEIADAAHEYLNSSIISNMIGYHYWITYESLRQVQSHLRDRAFRNGEGT